MEGSGGGGHHRVEEGNTTMNSITRRRPVIASLTGAALVAVILSGCSNTADTDPAVQSTPTRTSTSAPAEAASSAPQPPAAATSTRPAPSATSPQADASTHPSASGSKYQLNNPATWTIAGNEVGPIAIGGRTTAETDDLTAAYQLNAGECPAAPTTQFWANGKNPTLIVTTTSGNVSGVAVGNFAPKAVHATSPKTENGAGIGTSLTELQRLYPHLTYLGTYAQERAGFSLWGTDDHGGHISFELGEDGKNVGMVWVSPNPNPKPPYEFCG